MITAVSHNLFYYPYASFTNAQLPLLKVAALYFDNLFLLDPVGASWNTVGADRHAREAASLLESAGILQIVTPADVLAKYSGPITDAIRRDMQDRDFLHLCEVHAQETGKQRWTLSLAKVPQDMTTNQTMRRLMGDFARQVAGESQGYVEAAGGDPGAYGGYAEIGQTYDELRDGHRGPVEYRYADFPLALGEAIMMNHALFAGLLHAGATPITDDPFHSEALSLKLRRACQEPAVQRARADLARSQGIRSDLLAATALRDTQLDLPILHPDLPLEDILECRRKNEDALTRARGELGKLARSIEAEPWTDAFVHELDRKTIPEVGAALDEARKANDAWLSSQRSRLAMKVSGAALAVAGAALAVLAAPLTPVALASAAIGLATGTLIPGAEWLLDWRDGKKALQKNGLHYLLKVRSQ